jgi:hypothetical protein
MRNRLRDKDITNHGIHAGVEGPPLIRALALHLLKLPNMNHLAHNEGLYRINFRVNESGTMKLRLSDKVITSPVTSSRSFIKRNKLSNKNITNPGIHAGIDIIPQPMGVSPEFIYYAIR